jgi:hypothetical protein
MKIRVLHLAMVVVTVILLQLKGTQYEPPYSNIYTYIYKHKVNKFIDI